MSAGSGALCQVKAAGEEGRCFLLLLFCRRDATGWPLAMGWRYA